MAFHIATPSASPANASAPMRSVTKRGAPAPCCFSTASAHAQTCFSGEIIAIWKSGAVASLKPQHNRAERVPRPYQDSAGHQSGHKPKFDEQRAWSRRGAGCGSQSGVDVSMTRAGPSYDHDSAPTIRTVSDNRNPDRAPAGAAQYIRIGAEVAPYRRQIILCGQSGPRRYVLQGMPANPAGGARSKKLNHLEQNLDG